MDKWVHLDKRINKCTNYVNTCKKKYISRINWKIYEKVNSKWMNGRINEWMG